VKKTLLVLLTAVCVVAMAEDGARLLIISADTLYSSILPLAQWKHATGLSTRVVRLSQVGSDTTSIRNYIRNAWSTWPVKPEYVLLAGAQTFIPARAHRFWHNE
jgi:hypothetical protein